MQSLNYIDYADDGGFCMSYTFKIGKMPIKVGIEGQYYLESNDVFGQDGNIRFTITPALPAPDFAKKPLF